MGSASQPLSAHSQILNQTQAFTTDATGAATITFPNPPAGFTWTGTLNCAAATTGAVFLATVGGVSWGEWGGNSVYGPVQVLGQGSQQLIVSVTGLLASTGYSLQWNGSSDLSSNVAAVWPDANSTALTAQISGTVPVSVAGTVNTNSTITGGSVGITGSVATTGGSTKTTATGSGTSTTLSVVSTSSFSNQGIFSVAASGGQLIFSYTGTTSTSITGLTLLSGNSTWTIANGAPVVQSGSTNVSGTVGAVAIEHAPIAYQTQTLDSTTTSKTYLCALTPNDISMTLQFSGATFGPFGSGTCSLSVVGVTTGFVYYQQSSTQFITELTAAGQATLVFGLFGSIENVNVNLTGTFGAAQSITYNIIGIASSSPPVEAPVYTSNPTDSSNLPVPLQTTAATSTYGGVASGSGLFSGTFAGNVSGSYNLAVLRIQFDAANVTAGNSYLIQFDSQNLFYGNQSAKQYTLVPTQSTTYYEIWFQLPVAALAPSSANNWQLISTVTGSGTGTDNWNLTLLQTPNTMVVGNSPQNPLDTKLMGGGLYKQATVTTTSPGVSLLAAPRAGWAYSLHSWAVDTLPTAGSVRLWDGSTTGRVFGAIFTAGNAGGTQNLGGLITTGAVYVYGPSLTPATVRACVFYDLIQLPIIS